MKLTTTNITEVVMENKISPEMEKFYDLCKKLAKL